MSKITKKDIKELKERYENTMRNYEENITVIEGKMGVVRGIIETLERLEAK